LILHNTKQRGKGVTDPLLPEFFLVVVQYTARFNAEKMQKFARSLNGKLGKAHFNFQFVDPQVCLDIVQSIQCLVIVA
jgi:hypothetical protein